MTTPNRIDPTPVRLSNTPTVERQTPKRDFGDRVKVGLDQTTNAIASGAAVVGGFVPGGAIISAAVSSVSGMASNNTPRAGSSGGAVGAQYASTGIVSLGTPTSSGTSGTSVGGINYGSAGTGSSTSTTNYATGATSGSALGDANTSLIQSQQENAQMMNLQIAMQRENMVFTSVSNVLKTRYDTAKNSIGNVR